MKLYTNIRVTPFTHKSLRAEAKNLHYSLDTTISFLLGYYKAREKMARNKGAFETVDK